MMINKFNTNRRFLFLLKSLNETNYPGREYRKGYINALQKDLYELIVELKLKSEYPGMYSSIIPSCEFRVIPGKDDLQFDAYTSIIEENNKNICDTYISSGTLMALDDMFQRICCNEGILSHHENTTKIWYGTECLWLERSGRTFPKVRYFDYDPQELNSGLGKLNKQNKNLGKENYLSEFFSGIPIDDISRVELGISLVNLGVLWILLHEETHYWEGHLHFLNSVFGINKLSESKIENLNNDFFDDEKNIVLNKAFEWKADLKATDGLIDLVLNLQPTFFFKIPTYLTNAKLTKLRIIVFVIGMIILIFEKARKKYGISKKYPSPKTRLVGVISRIYERILSHKRADMSLPDVVASVSLGILDLSIASDLMYHISDFNHNERNKKISNYEAGKDYSELLNLWNYQESLNIIPEEYLQDTIQILTSGILYGNISVEKNKNLMNEWLNEFEEIHEYFHISKLDEKMSRYRKQTLLKGYIYKSDSKYF